MSQRKAVTRARARAYARADRAKKTQIPIRTWADWDDVTPGFVEIDLVGHDGGVASGEFCFTLAVTDIATGWTINRSVRNKAQKWVFEALQHVVAAFPFPIRGIAQVEVLKARRRVNLRGPWIVWLIAACVERSPTGGRHTLLPWRLLALEEGGHRARTAGNTGLPSSRSSRPNWCGSPREPAW